MQKSFQQRRVASFESRRAADMTKLIEKSGGVPFVSPSMREVALEDTSSLSDFARQIQTGQVDIVIFMTGVGLQHMMEAILQTEDRDRFLHSLRDIATVARGPKPVAAMKTYGLVPSHRVPEPNTWRELLSTLDDQLSVYNQTVAVQEYGQSNPSLIAGLEARGAKVIPLQVYRWELPEETELLDENIRAIIRGERDIAMFTSAHQATNLLHRARDLDCHAELQAGFRKVVVCSVGPTTSERLRQLGLQVDLEPTHPKMGTLVAEAAERSQELCERRKRIHLTLSGPASVATDEQAPWFDGPFMRACRREPTEITPVWLMRQAGRYMQEYRAIREKTTFLELCKNPKLCSEIMVVTVQKLGVDAAIIFSDLLPILEPMGLDLEYAKGEGPVIHNPVRNTEDVNRVLELESVDALDFVMETVRQTRNDLPADIPLIGFAGAPFTLASYAIEGGASRNYLHTKTLMYRDEGAWKALMQRLVRAITRYLNAQIAAGAQCVQLFDSWAGCLGVDDYRRYIQPHLSEVIAGLTPGVPVINFATGNPALLPCLREAGGDVIGVDWRIPLDSAWEMVGHDCAVQGNLDPLVLMATRETVISRARQILGMAAGRPGHIFNLGHGILPQTPVDNVIALVEAVHAWRAK